MLLADLHTHWCQYTLLFSFLFLFIFGMSSFYRCGFDPVNDGKEMVRKEYFWFLKDKDSPPIRTLKKHHDRASWCLNCLLCKEGSLGSMCIEYRKKYVCYWLGALSFQIFGVCFNLYHFSPLHYCNSIFSCKQMDTGKQNLAYVI